MTRKLPLSGLRVANFGWGWLGPVTGQTLARLGAEVYKIESHARVDINRTIPPFATGHENDPDRSLQNHAAWAGNGSVTINLKKPEGQKLARDMVAQCDLVLENFGPGVMQKLNIGYSDLSKKRTDLVMVSMPAAGLTGAMKNIRTYGMSLSSITGLDSITGYKNGPPIPMENAYADPLGGVIGAFAALLGLNYRKRTGKGQHVDFSQQEGVMQLMGPAFMDFTFNGRVAQPIGNEHPQQAAAPHGVFACAGDDRWISLAVLTQQEWLGLLTAMGKPSWAQGDEFSDPGRRVDNIDTLHGHVEQWCLQHDDYELARKLQACGVAAAPVLNVADLLSDPHYQARKTFLEIDHPLGFKETVYSNYVKTKHISPPLATGPAMGRDNEKVFKSILGVSAGDYDALVDGHVIF